MMGSSSFSWLLGRGGGSTKQRVSLKEEEEFGVTEKLQEFVRGLTVDTFKDFRLYQNDKCDDSVTTGDSIGVDHKHEENIQKDLTDWQQKHALLIVSGVKEFSKVRYVLCPRVMKDIDFWRIYFILAKKFLAPYELRATQKAKLKMMAAKEQEQTDKGVIEVEMTLSKPLDNTSPTIDL
ncbi:BSD domain-containing protein [Wolffia australiana]